ncbi:cation:proton antiporter [Pseudoroseicyclus aestuarii]|uniref:Sodium/proton antiporter (CPA1 family) n=1 Tax=Pseudoroseicyclus aestuarii TaxID=1795041 RepID=A0A318SUE0_9RHOB|nr:cation:proton antiporter [Pseudoroseicyclus aestuarii]PYE83989.1 sodium/proton antiporter (CPA1 family) [Pseudoroseicyclus aestuarii]
MIEGLGPVAAIALVGAIGVGSQWVAWRLRMPAIVLMLVAGLAVGPFSGLFSPSESFGDLLSPLISLAVAVILFEGGLSLNLSSLRDRSRGVGRLILVGAPLGWLLSTLALRYVGGMSWESATVFGGILIVTGPTVIAPLLRTAKLSSRPAALLQWEAIVNDPLGALAAVLAFEVVLVLNTAATPMTAVLDLALGVAVAVGIGAAAAKGISYAFQNGRTPEYMKVPILFAALLAVFAVADSVLHESGLLAVTVMGLGIANAGLSSYDELRRFKEHATVLLVSGVFILLAASMQLESLTTLDWRSLAVVLVIIFAVRPLTVLTSLFRSGVPWREQTLVALTGPRGVVLVAVAGLFGTRLTGLGVEDGDRIVPLAFALVAATVVLHGFSLAPMARWLGLSGAARPGVLIVGGSRFTLALSEALKKVEVPVLVADPNHNALRDFRTSGLATYSGDILSESAEQWLEFVTYDLVVAATANDAYNTLVATDMGPEFGRDNVYQIAREKGESARHQLSRTLTGIPFGPDETYWGLERLMREGWTIRVTRLTEEYGLAEWRERRPHSRLIARVSPGGEARFIRKDDEVRPAPGVRLISLIPPEDWQGTGRSERRAQATTSDARSPGRAAAETREGKEAPKEAPKPADTAPKGEGGPASRPSGAEGTGAAAPPGDGPENHSPPIPGRPSTA